MSPRARDDYTAAWICALPLELAAACAMLDERHDPLPLELDSRDTNNYVLGRLGPHNIVIACLPYGVTGTISAARVVNQMLATFKRIRFGLMVGIGGGVPSAQHDIRLGDVVVGSPTGLLGGIVQYDFGKTVQKGRFQRTGMLNKPPEFLLTALCNLQARHLMEGHRIEHSIHEMVNNYPIMSFQYARPAIDHLYRADYEHPESQQTCASCDASQLIHRTPRPPGAMGVCIHYGLIASGDQVVKNGQTRDALRQELDVLCFEMEAAGLIDSFPCLVVRGISDYADSHKNDLWQGYAAATAAAYAKELMHVIPTASNEQQQHLQHHVQVGGADSVSSDVRFRIQEWLSPASFKDDLYNHQKEYMNGSCDWALSRQEITSFMSTSHDSQILRIGGPPGIGKSTLTAFLIQRLIEAQNTVFYFFCKDTEGGKSHPFQVLRTLVSQALSADDGHRLVASLEKLRVESGQRQAESFATLDESFCYALSLLSSIHRSLYVVVDALDECKDGLLLASTLSAALNTSKRPFKLLLTGREEPRMLDFYRQYKERSISSRLAILREVTILPSTVQRPMVAYVKQRIAQCQHIRATPLGEQLFKELSASTEGSWLYAKLLLDEIERLPSPTSVARHLRSIPTGLVQLYHTILSTVEKSLSPAELHMAQQLFIWIDMKDFVLVGRNALDRDILDLVFQAANAGDEVFNSIDLARKLCSPLIILKSDRRDQCADLSVKVSFVHHTAMQFVRQSAARNEPSLAVPIILKPQLLKALHRANTAIWYFARSEEYRLLMECVVENPTRHVTRNPGAYFEMAYALWGSFFLEDLPECLDDDNKEHASLLCNKLTDFLLSGQCLRWVEIAIIVNYQWGFVNLFDNAVKALQAAKSSMSCACALPAFQAFSAARMDFFTDYSYVISCTGPADQQKLPVPRGFDRRPLAGALMRLGNSWAHLYTNRVF